ncbi:ATP-binding protein [Streptomyces cynarae]|uniref:ATP-binding protein n=1 Tax=Streptomyces cynarae TaxID=2981134 RepID=A0ABY6EBT4_9ACTN|nr:ATP-binding protein [Streptomyces cynarae]UXY24102.1 ATP-binding protein [Streptomyces cynarae]
MSHLAQRAFSPTPRTVRTARAFAMQALESWGGCRRRDDIRVCLSELAGNAVQHGSPDGRDYLVRLIRHPYCLHLEVHDSTRRAAVRTPVLSWSAEDGRGMHIVRELCDDWGVQTEDADHDGKVVWICFRRPEAAVSRCSCTP